MKQVVHQFECYGNEKAPDGINTFLDRHPGSCVAMITPVVIDFAGGQIGHGIMVVFETPEEG